MLETILLICPCGGNPSTENKKSCANFEIPISLVLAVVLGVGASLAAYALTQGAIRSTFFIGGAGALFSGLVGYLFLRYVFKTTHALNEEKKDELQKLNHPKSSLSDTRATSGLSSSAVKVDKELLSEVLHIYQAHLTKEEIQELKISNGEGWLKITFKVFTVTIRKQDIFESRAQVIVNAANTHLGGGGGIDGEIHTRGGDAYRLEHQKLCSYYKGKYTSGYAAMINSGKLEDIGIDNVIVVAGPIEGDSSMTKNEKNNALYSCYYNSLLLAHEHGKESIAFPSISTGIFGFNKTLAARISLKAIYDFMAAHPNSTLKTISIHWQEDKKAGPNKITVLEAYNLALKPE